MVAPAGTPPNIVKLLNQEVEKAVHDDELRKRMLEMGNPPFLKSPEETQAFVKSEVLKFSGIARAINLNLD